MELHAGLIINNFKIIKPIGGGGMGEIYLAEETLLGRQVAIKRLSPLLTGDPQFSERFINEARIQAQLIHPNIVALLSFFIHEGIYYMAMEYASGITLKDLIARTGPIPEQRALAIFRQIIEALSYAHSKGIIHRDIKPSNIMIDEQDRVKLMDFGIARILGDGHLTRTGTKVGTLFYMSPEQVKAAKDIDHRSDIYSAGIVLYEVLTGRLPYTADTDSDFEVMLEIVNRQIPDPREVYPYISDRMVEILINLTQKDIAKRYQDCSLILQSSDGYKQGVFISEKTATVKTEIHTRKSPVDFVYVEGGRFFMGSDTGYKDEKPVHKVTVSSFYMSRFAVSQKEWEEVMGHNPSHFIGYDLPVESISWYEALVFCNTRSILDGLRPCYSILGSKKPSDWGKPPIEPTAAWDEVLCDWRDNGYRLPTEAEWEYAARGGKENLGYRFSGSDDIDNIAWYSANNSPYGTKRLGQKIPNSLGIHDMSGNVWEWCWDIYGQYQSDEYTSPSQLSKMTRRIRRGGCWQSDAEDCSNSVRGSCNPSSSGFNIGLRYVRVYS